MNDVVMYDVIILGSGPAGLTAALYTSRANKKTLVLGGDRLGGQTAGIAVLENYPGWAGSGSELAELATQTADLIFCVIMADVMSGALLSSRRVRHRADCK